MFHLKAFLQGFRKILVRGVLARAQHENVMHMQHSLRSVAHETLFRLKQEEVAKVCFLLHGDGRIRLADET